MGGRGKPKVTLTARVTEYAKEGMYVFDSLKKLMGCKYCGCRVDWIRKSTVDGHISSTLHKESKSKAKSPNTTSSKRQFGIAHSLNNASKAKDDRETFIKSTVHAFVKANIPLHKLDNPSMRKWIKEFIPGKYNLAFFFCFFFRRVLIFIKTVHITCIFVVRIGGGDLPKSKWLRKHYLPLIKKDYDEEIKEYLKGKKINILCDETTNKNGEAAFLVLFQILPDDMNTVPSIIVAGVKILSACTGDETSKALLQV